MTTTPPGITERNHAHEQADLHDILRLLAVVEDRTARLEEAINSIAELIEEFGPLLSAYRATAGGTVGVFRARKALRNGHG